MTDTTRTTFEAFYLTVDKTADFKRAANNGHDYYFDSEQDAWRFWQAATLKATLAERERIRKHAGSNATLHDVFQAIWSGEPLPPTGTEQS